MSIYGIKIDRLKIGNEVQIYDELENYFTLVFSDLKQLFSNTENTY